MGVFSPILLDFGPNRAILEEIWTIIKDFREFKTKWTAGFSNLNKTK